MRIKTRVGGVHKVNSGTSTCSQVAGRLPFLKGMKTPAHVSVLLGQLRYFVVRRYEYGLYLSRNFDVRYALLLVSISQVVVSTKTPTTQKYFLYGSTIL